MMKIKVLYFAEAERVAGVREETVEFSGKSIDEFLHYLATKHPNLNTLVDKITVAVNMEYANRGASLKSGDIVAIIPPVQGG